METADAMTTGINFRCPIDKGFLHFSFRDDSAEHYNVYRCTRCTSSDERLFIKYSDRLVEVRVQRRPGAEKEGPRYYAVPLNDEEMKKVRAAEQQRRRHAELHNTINTARFFADLEDFNRRRRAFEALMIAPPEEMGAAILANIAAELLSPLDVERGVINADGSRELIPSTPQEMMDA